MSELKLLEYRILGKTTLRVSELGFGCGAVGGILVNGSRREMAQAVARAIELGINYFDTAALYGDGKSEQNLGLVLAELGADVIVGTKVRLLPAELEHIEQAVVTSVESSLKRLRRDYIDLIQLHARRNRTPPGMAVGKHCGCRSDHDRFSQAPSPGQSALLGLQRAWGKRGAASGNHR
jgi:aryl-alcohol dehydrogenase-like predicted oxidoreductase